MINPNRAASAALIKHDRAIPMMTTLLEVYGSAFPPHPGKWRIHSYLRKKLRVTPPAGNRLVTRGGMSWWIDPQDYVQSDLYWLGEKDRWNLYHIAENVTQHQTIFDVGANFGYYSIMLAGKGGQSHVHAFEPNPPTFQRLVRNVSLNRLDGLVTAHAFGLSDSEQKVGIIEREGNSGAAAMDYAKESERHITLTTLDLFCQQNRINNVDFIKVDIEGSEYRMLQGAEATLRASKPHMLIELNPYAAVKQGSSVGAIVSILLDLKYRLFVSRKRRLVPLISLPGGEDHLDVFCFHEERIAQSTGLGTRR